MQAAARRRSRQRQSANLPPMGEPWSGRSFEFNFPIERFPVILDRIRGTPHRMEAKLRGVDAATLARRPAGPTAGGAWSLQEHVGHFKDLDLLHLKRLGEIEATAPSLSPHDMKNTATWEADYNARPYGEVWAAFLASRQTLVGRLEGWDPAELGRSAMHHRIGKPMRVVDLAFFVAEHDDYYLAEMHAVLAGWGLR